MILYNSVKTLHQEFQSTHSPTKLPLETEWAINLTLIPSQEFFTYVDGLLYCHRDIYNLNQNHRSLAKEISNEKVRKSVGNQNRFSTIKPFKIFQSYHISPESQVE
jgi:hypothetical protein